MAHSDVGVSFSRPSRGASSSIDCIKAARSTEGLFPATAAKKKTKRIPATAECLRRPSRTASSPDRTDTCNPETATTWAMPERRSAEYSAPGRPERSPVIRAAARGAALSGKQRRTLSFRALAIQAGQYRGGIRSGRITAVAPPSA